MAADTIPRLNRWGSWIIMWIINKHNWSKSMLKCLAVLGHCMKCWLLVYQATGMGFWPMLMVNIPKNSRFLILSKLPAEVLQLQHIIGKVNYSIKHLMKSNEIVFNTTTKKVSNMESFIVKTSIPIHMCLQMDIIYCTRISRICYWYIPWISMPRDIVIRLFQKNTEKP